MDAWDCVLVASNANIDKGSLNQLRQQFGREPTGKRIFAMLQIAGCIGFHASEK